MEVLDIYREDDVIIMKIAPDFNKSAVHTIYLDNHIDNRNLLNKFRQIKYNDLKAKHSVLNSMKHD